MGVDVAGTRSDDIINFEVKVVKYITILL
jgi:hypothetical protein